MPILHTALPVEGRILKSKLKLKPLPQLRKIEIYGSEDTILVISGVGKIPTASALSFVAGVYPQATDYFLNLGIAGSCRREYSLGQAFLISQVKDRATGRYYYPDLIYKSPWNLANLATFDRPYSGEPPEGFDLVDMEASAFFQTALYHAEAHRIHSVKVVSDYLDGTFCQAKDVEVWMEKNADEILHWLEVNRNDPAPEEISHPDYELLKNEIIDNLLLSQSQSIELDKALNSYTKRKKTLPESYKKYLYKRTEPRNKENGKKKLQSLLAVLYDT